MSLYTVPPTVTFAVIVDSPTATPVTTPLSTVATVGSDDVHSTSASPLLIIFALSVTVEPLFTVAVAFSISTEGSFVNSTFRRLPVKPRAYR